MWCKHHAGEQCEHDTPMNAAASPNIQRHAVADDILTGALYTFRQCVPFTFRHHTCILHLQQCVQTCFAALLYRRIYSAAVPSYGVWRVHPRCLCYSCGAAVHHHSECVSLDLYISRVRWQSTTDACAWREHPCSQAPCTCTVDLPLSLSLLAAG